MAGEDIRGGALSSSLWSPLVPPQQFCFNFRTGRVGVYKTDCLTLLVRRGSIHLRGLKLCLLNISDGTAAMPVEVMGIKLNRERSWLSPCLSRC